MAKKKEDRALVATPTYSPSKPNVLKQFREAFNSPLVLRVRGSVLPSLCVPVALLSLYSALYVWLHKFGLTLSLTSSLVPILSLVTGLLVSFRTSSAYDRWWEGRRCWSSMLCVIRNFARTVWTHVNDGETSEDEQLKKEYLNLLPAFARAVKHHLREEKGLHYPDLEGYLPKRYVNQFNSGKVPHNLPVEVTYLMTSYTDLLVSSKRMEPSHVGSMNAFINSLTDSLSALERISNTPIPLAYQIHLKQLVTLYCLSLAPQLVDSLGYYCVIVTAFAAFAFFGVEFIGLEIENPFGYDYNDLPLEKFCQEIEQEMQSLVGIPYNPAQWKERANTKRR